MKFAKTWQKIKHIETQQGRVSSLGSLLHFCLCLFVITKLCPNLNASEVTKEKALYVYAICHDIPFDIGRVINEDILEHMERAANTALDSHP